MNLIIITINNAQMRAICEAKFKDAQMTIERKISREVILKEEKRMLCVVTVKIQLTSSIKSQTLSKEKSFQDFVHGRVSERFLTGFDTRGQPNHGPVFAQMLLNGFSLP